MRLDSTVDVAVDLAGPDSVEDAVPCPGWCARRLDRRPGERRCRLLGEVDDVAELCRPWESMKSCRAVEHDAGQVRGRVDHLANAVLQGVGGGEEQAAVGKDATTPGNCSSSGCSARSRKTWVPGSRARIGILGGWRPRSARAGTARSRSRPRRERRIARCRESPRWRSRSRIAGLGPAGASRGRSSCPSRPPR